MARPIKEGLDYFPIDVDMDYDDKVQVIEGLHGSAGFATIIKVLMKIYSNGYFYQYGEQEQILLAKRIGIDVNTLNNVISDCVKYGLFHEKLFNEFQLLTSRGIQIRYFNAVGKRKKGHVFKEYLLIPQSEMLEYCPNMILKTVIQDKTVQGDGVIHGKTIQDKGVIQEFSTQSKVKDSKGNKSKVEEIKNAANNAHLFYQENFGIANPTVIQTIEHWINDLNEEMVIEAMRRAAVDQKSFRYAEGIMKKWLNKNITTMQQVQADDVAFSNKNEKPNGIYNQEFKRTPEDEERIRRFMEGTEVTQEFLDQLI